MIYTFDLTSKVILITGGYGYLGKAITESLLYHGATIYVLGKNESKFYETFSNEITDKKRLFFQRCDVSETADIVAAYENIHKIEGIIDVIINNAFYSKGSSPELMTDEEWLHGVDGTLSNVFRCIRGIIPYFRMHKKGKIINVSSMYGVVAPQFEIYDEFIEFLNPPHYGASKAGIIQLTKYYASYLGKYNVNVNTITPGPFPSNKVKEKEKFVELLADNTSLKRVGHPDDLAGSFVFLASDAANYITGQNIIVDGGWTSR